MRALLLLPLLALGCGGKEDSASDDSATDDSASDDSAADDSSSDDSASEIESACTEAPAVDAGCVDYDGTARAITGVAFLGSGSGAGLVRLYQSADGLGAQPVLAIDYEVGLTAGAHACDGRTIVTLTSELGYHGANVDLAAYGAWCTLTLDATGSQVGDPVQGSFVGQLYASDGSLIPVSGRFNTTLAF